MNCEQTRSFAGAFLRWQNEALLLKRGKHKQISPGLWAGVSGQIEPYDLGSPSTACMREIEEETGIVPTQIEQLELRYFALLKTEGTLDSVYYFSGVLKEKPLLPETSEGVLHWVKLEAGVNLPMPAHIKAFYIHWINNLFDGNIYCFFDK